MGQTICGGVSGFVGLHCGGPKNCAELSNLSGKSARLDVPSLSETITDEVTSRPGVEAGYGNRGEW